MDDIIAHFDTHSITNLNNPNGEEAMINQFGLFKQNLQKYIKTTMTKTTELKNDTNQKMEMLCRSMFENMFNEGVKETHNYELERRKNLLVGNVSDKLLSVEPKVLLQSSGEQLLLNLNEEVLHNNDDTVNKEMDKLCTWFSNLSLK
jgi:hypothetical protein